MASSQTGVAAEAPGGAAQTGTTCGRATTADTATALLRVEQKLRTGRTQRSAAPACVPSSEVVPRSPSLKGGRLAQTPARGIGTDQAGHGLHFRRLGKMEGKRRLEEGEEGAGRCSKVLRLTASPGLQPCVLRTLE